MKLEHQNKIIFLVKGGIRVPLGDSDVRVLRVMTPMGRKVHMRRKALVLLEEDQGNVDAKSILELVKLPARNWAFEFPEKEL